MPLRSLLPRRVRGSSLCALFLALASPAVLAQADDPAVPLEEDPERLQALLATARQPWEDYATQLQSRKALAAHGPELFGDSVNLYNGALSFSVTDIALPGNSGLPVALTRTFSIGAYPAGKPLDGAFGDWEIDLPRIEGVYGPTWHNARCSSPLPGIAMGGSASYTPEDYWQGLQAQMPAGGELLVADTGTPQPSTGGPYAFVTAGLTYVKCLPSIANGVGEGFEALTSDGTRYAFRWMAQTFETPLASPINIGSGTGALIRKRNALYVTRIEDRFGHWVDYSYTNAATEPVRLSSIEARDGRRIDFSYSNGRISTATAHGRTWAYGYDNAAAQNGSLNTVTLPDDSQWQVALRTLAQAEIQYSQGDPRNCSSAGRLLTSNQSASGTVTHPAGAIGTFLVEPIRHGRSNVPRLCVNWEFGVNDPSNDVAYLPREFHAWSLTSKTVTGPALSPMNWAYAYSGTKTWACPNDTPPHAQSSCPAPASIEPVCLSDACAGSATATVSGPNNDWRRYVFGNSYRYDEGLLRTVERGTGPDHILHTETTRYQLAQSGQPYVLPRGRSLRARGDGFISEQPRPRSQHQIARDGATFTWSGGGVDAFARPTTVTRASSLGDSRTEVLDYYDQLSLWVLGQPRTTTVGALTVSQTVYDPATALPVEQFAFGQRQWRRTYHGSGDQAGLTHQVFDGGDVNAIVLDDYKRGIPRNVSLPTGHAMSAQVSDRGEIERVTDAVGHSTVYAFDPMGRVRTVTPPSGDVVSWTPTTIAYQRIASVEYGIAAGHWRRVETTGARVHETFYDGLWRPVLTRQSATDASVGSRSVRRAFDHEGRETFASYPSDALNTPALHDYTSLNQGLATTFDALGRVTGTQQHSEKGLLHTSVDYLSPFITRHTDARGHSTTTTWQAFDAPVQDAPRTVTEPEGVTTTYTRDVFGKPLTLTRSGAYTPPGGSPESLSMQRRYVYDSQQRLCKTVEPDAGITVLEYDSAGNLAWRATGQNALTHSTDCQRGSTVAGERSLYRYDALNRLLSIDHSAGTADVGYTYEGDGALSSTTVGVLNTGATSWLSVHNQWAYTYNKRRLLESETLSIDGRSFVLDWRYQARGDLDGLVYPSGLDIGFHPNAYGEPRQAASFATGASYFANGRLSGFGYGNGATRTVTQNARQLPMHLRDQRFGVTLLDHSLTYDENANLVRLFDGVPGALENRTLSYDDRNRLVVVNATTGVETYAYDPLDNVRRRVMGGIDERFHYAPATQRLTAIRDASNTLRREYSWNDRGELTQRSRYTVGTPSYGPPTLFKDGFEQALIRTDEAFEFDRAGRLAGSQNQVSYQYDAHGRRVRTTFATFGTRYQVYSQAGVLLYVDDSSSNERIDYVLMSGQLVAERIRAISGGTEATHTLHADRLGTPSVKTSSTGSVLQRSRLQPYGRPYDGIWRDGPGFTGHAMDAHSELVYMQQRYYDPEMMRFLSTDPVAAGVGNFNRYEYANNNPYKFVDPDGRFTRIPASAWNQRAQDAGIARTQAAMASTRASASTVADFVPVVGDAKAIAEAVENPTPANIIAAGVGLVPVVGDATAKAIKAGDKIVDAARVGNLPKPPTGAGSVPRSDRDPKRLFTPGERAAKRDDQGGVCATGCGAQIDEFNSAGHHIQRHADGGKTIPDNHAEVCNPCHDKLHSRGEQ